MDLHLAEPEYFTHWMTADPPYECKPEERPFNLFEAYLFDHLSLEELIDKLVNQTESHGALDFILETFNFIVPQVDYGHPAHIKLALFLTTLMRLKIGGVPSESVTTGETQIDCEGPWGPLAKWRFEYRTWEPAADKARDEDDEGPEADTIRREWTNCNAFIAQLVSIYGFYQYDHYALYAMRWALEESTICKRQITAHELGMEVPAAAAWIAEAGEWMWKCRRVWEGQGDAGDGGDLWDGVRGFCPERWALWQRRFEWVVGREDVRDEARNAAGEAARRMREIAPGDIG